MKEIIAKPGINELTGPGPGKWFTSPQDEGSLDLRQTNGVSAFLSVLHEGTYYVGFASGDGIEWTKIVFSTPGPLPGPGWMSRLWGKAKAMGAALLGATKGAIPFVLTAVLTAGTMLALVQAKGCDWEWIKPVPPVPPTPPVPPPSPAPIPGDGLRVLFIYETGRKPPLPPEQLSAIFGKEVRDYLDAKCPVGPDGKTKEWRAFDKDTQSSEKTWADALARKRDSEPWLIVSDGKSGYEGPLPKTVAETITILKKYGG